MNDDTLTIDHFLAFCNASNIDLVDAFVAKLESTKKKYPVNKVKGKAVKYTEI